jgi:PPE-repeat protein
MPVFGDWAATPPEGNAYALLTGDHAASTTAAAAALQALADALASEGAMMGTTTVGTAAAGWQGAGGVSMLGSSAEYIAALELLMAWVQDASQAAAGIAEAYQTAFTTMIPGPVCDSNRVAQAGLVATNFMGFNTPGIIALDTEYFGHMWTNNAAVMAAYELAVTGLLALLALPPPISPATGDPAGAAAGAAMDAAQAGGNAAMKAGVQSMDQTASTVQPTEQAATAGPAAAGEMSSAMPMVLGQLGQIGQLAGQAPQIVSQLPQMLGQMPQLATGLLGPLSSSFSSLGNSAAVADPAAATPAQTALTSGGGGGLGAAGGGGGGVGIGAPGAGVVSSFTRPSSSFNAPSPPKLPTGWSAVANEPPAAVGSSTQPMAGGMGGLYGAPAAAAMGRDGAESAEKAPARTMQLTGRPAPNRGNSRQN